MPIPPRATEGDLCPQDEQVRAVLPPELAKRIHERTGVVDHNGCVPSTYFERLWGRFEKDRSFRHRMLAKAKELEAIALDVDNPSWGEWPDDLEECAAIGLILGILLQTRLEIEPGHARGAFGSGGGRIPSRF